MSNIKIDDDVFLLTDSKYRYDITYENVQLYEIVNRDAKLTRILKSFVFNEKKISFFEELRNECRSNRMFRRDSTSNEN